MSEAGRTSRPRLQDLQNYQSFTGLSCSRCKANGIECDLLKPCTSCVSQGIENECSDGDSYSPLCDENDRSIMLASLTKMEHDDGDIVNEEKDLRSQEMQIKDYKTGGARSASPDALLKALMNFDAKVQTEKPIDQSPFNEGTDSLNRQQIPDVSRNDITISKSTDEAAPVAGTLPEYSHKPGCSRFEECHSRTLESKIPNQIEAFALAQIPRNKQEHKKTSVNSPDSEEQNPTKQQEHKEAILSSQDSKSQQTLTGVDASMIAKDQGSPLKKKKKRKRPEEAPRLPCSPFVLFSNKVRESVKEENPGIGFLEMGKKIGEKWRALDGEERKKYEDEAGILRLSYLEKKKRWESENKKNER
eukprot:760036-Hanusia_phi.AAC.1